MNLQITPPAEAGGALGPKPGAFTYDAWNAYSTAYQDRYGIAPLWNSTNAGKVANFIKRVGKDEAPHVARFFVGINDQYLIRNFHDIGLLLKGVDGYRTQWATGKQMTTTKARQIDQTATNASAADQAKQMLRERGSQQGGAQ